jgi:energy-coupling factor transport system substrate-specific component
MSICSNIYNVIKSGMEKAETVVQMEIFQKELKNKVEEQTLELREGKKKLKESYIQTVSALGEAVDAKDRYTSGHSKRVAEYAKIIAEKMGKSLEEQEIVYRAGLLHDVGKIRIPNEIINKKGRLTDEEYNLIKIHPVTGYHILGSIPDH